MAMPPYGRSVTASSVWDATRYISLCERHVFAPCVGAIHWPPYIRPRLPPTHLRHQRVRFLGRFSFVDRFEVEISQIHVSVRQYVYGENVPPFAEMNFEELRSQIPMVPLTPRKRVCWIICCCNLHRPGCVPSAHID